MKNMLLYVNTEILLCICYSPLLSETDNKTHVSVHACKRVAEAVFLMQTRLNAPLKGV